MKKPMLDSVKMLLRRNGHKGCVNKALLPSQPAASNIQIKTECDTSLWLQWIAALKAVPFDSFNPRVAELTTGILEKKDKLPYDETVEVETVLLTRIKPSARMQRLLRATQKNDAYALAIELNDLKEGVKP